MSDFLSHADSERYYKAIKNCLKNGASSCSYYVEGTLFFCTMKRISNIRIKVVEIADLG